MTQTVKKDALMSITMWKRWLKQRDKHPHYEALKKATRDATTPLSVYNLINRVIQNALEDDNQDPVVHFAIEARKAVRFETLYRVFAPGHYIRVVQRNVTKSRGGNYTRHYCVEGVDHDERGVPFIIDVTEDVSFLLGLRYNYNTGLLASDQAKYSSDGAIWLGVSRELYDVDTQLLRMRGGN